MLRSLLTALAALNLATFAAFGLDKALARRGARRISERTLLGLSFLGGAPGGWAAMLVFRHKTRKPPFRTWMVLAGILWLGVLVLAWGSGVARTP